MGIHWSYGGNYFTIYTNIKSLCYIPETNTMLWQLYLSEKKKTPNYFPLLIFLWICLSSYILVLNIYGQKFPYINLKNYPTLHILLIKRI